MNQPGLFVNSITVTDLTRYLHAVLESDDVLQDLWVQGEISNLSRPSSGHLYFTLKDSSAALKCVMWRTAAASLRFTPQNGQAVEAHGKISIYDRDGVYQLYAEALRPVGEGWLYQEFLRLKARLEAEGLFEAERHRPLPARPQTIGIVTSPTGAALQDMLNTLRRRYPFAEVLLAPAAVQGDEAPPEIVRALRALWRMKPDVIIVGRGGGSLEDLWAFNDERVVRAIAASPIPVICGVGHETDVTLSDYAADVRAPTPTGAAVLATPDVADLRTAFSQVQFRLGAAGLRQVEQRRSELEPLTYRLQRATPLGRIRNDRQRLDAISGQAGRALSHRLALEKAHLHGLETRLAALNPLAVLERGFAVVRDASGNVIRRAAQVQPGQSIDIRLSAGSLEGLVKKVSSE